MSNSKVVPGTGGEHYIPYEERTGNESVVYFTRDLSAEGLRRIFNRVNKNLSGKVGIKLHTGEKNGPNIIPRPWVESLIKNDLPGCHNSGDKHLLRRRSLHHRPASGNFESQRLDILPCGYYG